MSEVREYIVNEQVGESCAATRGSPVLLTGRVPAVQPVLHTVSAGRKRGRPVDSPVTKAYKALEAAEKAAVDATVKRYNEEFYDDEPEPEDYSSESVYAREHERWEKRERKYAVVQLELDEAKDAYIDALLMDDALKAKERENKWLKQLIQEKERHMNTLARLESEQELIEQLEGEHELTDDLITAQKRLIESYESRDKLDALATEADEREAHVYELWLRGVI